MLHRGDDVPLTNRPDPQASVGKEDASVETEKTEKGEMPCPVCGTPMPDRKGGKASICRVCGFKDSCCF